MASQHDPQTLTKVQKAVLLFLDKHKGRTCYIYGAGRRPGWLETEQRKPVIYCSYVVIWALTCRDLIKSTGSGCYELTALGAAKVKALKEKLAHG